ncbi:hypothetical protein HBN50_11645 [Halobacteriovorax sp. GB3]|uniref:hypothetical protein n=1 Tax=Halobacteriovorax sp. GB3 TaxID=2719615 RepID=UPI00235DE594|nr:hypothetical protein [Halobacteriovorax sp. GB3]MDD0853754.1 hypothetical protein [Halobacteriovorax sp. GB3]
MIEQKIFHYIIRVPKEESAFTYFQLEANENLCFYSTLESSVKEGFRDIMIKGTLEMKEEVTRIIGKLKEQYPIEILVDEIIE